MLTDFLTNFARYDIVLLLCVVASFFVYNNVVGKKNEVENAMGGLDSQLKMRYDLIPNLVSTVKMYMKHEESVLKAIVELRTKVLKDNVTMEMKAQMNGELSRNLSNLMVQVEQYPDLKANTNFMDLQNKLYEIEQNISASRRFYNTAVTDYNNALEMVPTNIFAKILGYKRKDVFVIPEAERAVVDVHKLFNDKAS